MNQAFIVTKEHRRFTEFANAVRKERTIGICHGDAGVGKTNSARRYANWDVLEPYINEWGPRGDHDAKHYALANRSRTVFYTPEVLCRPKDLMHDIDHWQARVGICADEHLRSLEAEFRFKRLGRTLDPDDFTDAQAVASIERITRGNFRLLERLFPQIARVLKINELEIITDDVIEAAASILVIGN